jgi:hypothetical protein
VEEDGDIEDGAIERVILADVSVQVTAVEEHPNALSVVFVLGVEVFYEIGCVFLFESFNDFIDVDGIERVVNSKLPIWSVLAALEHALAKRFVVARGVIWIVV